MMNHVNVGTIGHIDHGTGESCTKATVVIVTGASKQIIESMMTSQALETQGHRVVVLDAGDYPSKSAEDIVADIAAAEAAMEASMIMPKDVLVLGHSPIYIRGEIEALPACAWQVKISPVHRQHNLRDRWGRIK